MFPIADACDALRIGEARFVARQVPERRAQAASHCGERGEQPPDIPAGIDGFLVTEIPRGDALGERHRAVKGLGQSLDQQDHEADRAHQRDDRRGQNDPYLPLHAQREVFDVCVLPEVVGIGERRQQRVDAIRDRTKREKLLHGRIAAGGISKGVDEVHVGFALEGPIPGLEGEERLPGLLQRLPCAVAERPRVDRVGHSVEEDFVVVPGLTGECNALQLELDGVGVPYVGQSLIHENQRDRGDDDRELQNDRGLE